MDEQPKIHRFSFDIEEGDSAEFTALICEGFISLQSSHPIFLRRHKDLTWYIFVDSFKKEDCEDDEHSRDLYSRLYLKLKDIIEEDFWKLKTPS